MLFTVVTISLLYPLPHHVNVTTFDQYLCKSLRSDSAELYIIYDHPFFFEAAFARRIPVCISHGGQLVPSICCQIMSPCSCLPKMMRAARLAVKWKDWNGVTLGFRCFGHGRCKQTPFPTPWGNTAVWQKGLREIRACIAAAA